MIALFLVDKGKKKSVLVFCCCVTIATESVGTAPVLVPQFLQFRSSTESSDAP